VLSAAGNAEIKQSGRAARQIAQDIHVPKHQNAVQLRTAGD
jgi:hypothetical protein